ncbi:AAA family ATPase [Antarcticimicrobium luteum]|uniref:ATP-binding protein n=1 Tax=Antarcticimicrobium luteum TaxID=2547397 RepID=A0A4R5V6P9_9RHOB|nr:ATP-binding protein [Antarcticimicrobium luteum]TDK47491.1 ATP-binding protein [Antarcticimicrobium luteum]
MSQTNPTLHLVCGKAASGKSTLTARLAQNARSVVIAEDEWLAALYGDQMTSIADYVRCAANLRGVVKPHVVALLGAGVSVVLDFPANTVETRQWMRGIVEASNAAHLLHYLNVPEDVCKARLRARNARGDHPFSVTDEEFDQLSRHFVPPSEDEGFDIVTHQFQ